MRSKSEFFDNYRDMIKKHIKALQDKQAELNEIDEKEELGIYDGTMLLNERKRIRKESEDLQASNRKEIEELCNDYINELEVSGALKGEDITDDIKVLQSGITLTNKDLEAMFDRNRNNHTMAKIISQYATEHNINMHTTYIDPYQDTKRVVSGLPYTSMVCEKWYNKPDVYEKLCGDDSNFAHYFSD